MGLKLVNVLSVGFLILLCHINSVSSYKCHVCSTKTPDEDDCIHIEPGNTKYLRDCPAPHNVTCRIVEQYIEFDIFEWQRDKHVLRQCGKVAHDPEAPCYYRTGYGGRMSVCNCNGDGCNDTTRYLSSLTLTLTALLFLFLRL